MHLLWQRLENDLQRAVAAFPGLAGLCVRDLTSSWTIDINGDEAFPTASTIKIPVLMELLRRAEVGELHLDERVTITSALHVGGSGVLTHLEGDLQLSWLDIAILMVIVSDNTATNLCIDRVGIGAVNALLAELGLAQTKLARKMMDHPLARLDQENLATPAELTTLMTLLYAGKPTPWVAERTLAILKKPKDGFLNKAIPADPRFDLPIAHKPGWTTGVCCDAGLVYLPRHPYAVAVMSKYALCEAAVQEQQVIDLFRLIHQTMQTLNGANAYGHGVFPV